MIIWPSAVDCMMMSKLGNDIPDLIDDEVKVVIKSEPIEDESTCYDNTYSSSASSGVKVEANSFCHLVPSLDHPIKKEFTHDLNDDYHDLRANNVVVKVEDFDDDPKSKYYGHSRDQLTSSTNAVSPDHCFSARESECEIFPPEWTNRLCILDSTCEVFFEWTSTPEPAANSACAVLIEKEGTSGEGKGESPDDERVSGENYTPAARIYICHDCDNAYLTCNDLYKHYAVCEKEEDDDDDDDDERMFPDLAETKISLADDHESDGSSKEADIPRGGDAPRISSLETVPDSPASSTNIIPAYPTKDQLPTNDATPTTSLRRSVTKSNITRLLNCPCCNKASKSVSSLAQHMTSEICSAKLNCRDCWHMMKLKFVPLVMVHTVEESIGRCVRSCASCTFAEPSSLIEYDDHLLTHPICMLCFKVLQTDLGLRRHLSSSHKIDAQELMSNPKKYVGPANLDSLPATLDGRLLMLKRLPKVMLSDRPRGGGGNGVSGVSFTFAAPLYPCPTCGEQFDSTDQLQRHFSSIEICKGCHKPNVRKTAETTRKPSILKRKPVQTFCADCHLRNDPKRLKIS